MIRSRVTAAVAFGVALLMSPSTAWAQLDAFVEAARGVAEASGRDEPARSSGIRAAAGRMAAALDGWDRNLRAREAVVTRTLQANPAPAYQLHVELAVAFRARGRLDDALREFAAALAIKPSADLHVLRGLTLEAAGRTGEAGQAFRAAWTLDAGDPVKAYLVAQRSDASTSERDRARAVLRDTYQREAVSGRPARPAAVPPFAVLDVIPDTLSRTPIVADEASAPGFALLGARQYPEAVAALQGIGVDGVAKGGDSPLAQFARGQRDEAENQVGEARRAYQAAVAGTLAGRSVLLVAIGRLAHVEGDLPAAIEALSRAALVNPNDPAIRRELAGAHAASGRAEDALCELVAAFLIDRRDPQVHAAIGQLFAADGRHAEAVAAFDRALELAPEAYEVRYALAAAHARLGHAGEAARQLELFEQARRAAEAERRRVIARDAEDEERRRGGIPAPDGGR